MLPKNADKNLFFCYSRIYIRDIQLMGWLRLSSIDHI